MSIGAGHDTYYVGNVGDQVVEQGNQGNDLLRTTISYTLLANVERLKLLSASNIAGTGNALNNTITESSGANTITSFGRADSLTGGAGRDTFVFASLTDSTVATGGRDTTEDFTQADTDRIDLRPIDANTALAGDQALPWIGASAFSGKAGELHFEASGTDTLVSDDLDGNGSANFAILVNGQIALQRGDFLLRKQCSRPSQAARWRPISGVVLTTLPSPAPPPAWAINSRQKRRARSIFQAIDSIVFLITTQISN